MFMINDVRDCYMCKIGEVGYCKLREVYAKLCDNGILKDEYKVAKMKKLTCALNFLQKFKNEWIRIMLRRVHNGHIWLENGPIKISKIIIHRVTRYPTLGRPKTMRCEPKENIEKDTRVV